MREISQASEIIRARSDEIIFEADLDGDASVETITTITFDVSKDGNLERTEDRQGQDLVVIMTPGVQSFTLGYYLAEDNDTLLGSVTGPSLDDIRVVVISLGATEADETFSLSASAYARNQGLDD